MVVAVESTPFHVLAVDDSFIDRKLIERLLKTSSYHVTAVDSGTKALEFLGLVQHHDQQTDSKIAPDQNHHHQVRSLHSLHSISHHSTLFLSFFL